MAVKKKRYKLQHGDVIDIEEYHDGRYGAPGKKRQKRKTPTKEEMQKVNDYNKTKRCRLRMLEHIRPGDCFATLTYEISRRPPDMKTAKEHFRKMLEKTVRKEYRKRGSSALLVSEHRAGNKRSMAYSFGDHGNRRHSVHFEKGMEARRRALH